MPTPFSAIPLPGTMADAFEHGVSLGNTMLNSMMARKMTPYEIELKKAQAQEAAQKAAEHQLYSNMTLAYLRQHPELAALLGGQQGVNQPSVQPNQMPIPNQPTGLTNQQIQGIPAPGMQPGDEIKFGGQPVSQQGNQPSRNQLIGSVQNTPGTNQYPGANPIEMLIANRMGMAPTFKDINGQVVGITPFTDLSKLPRGETPAQKRLAEAQTGATKKTLESLNESQLASSNIRDSISGMKDLLANPAYASIDPAKARLATAQPFGLPLNLATQNILPPEQQTLLGTATSYMGNLEADFAKRFKGPYRNSIMGLVGTVKPKEGDSYALKVGKLKALDVLDKLANQRDELIDNYINKGYSSFQAQTRASKDIPFDKIKKAVEKEYIDIEKKGGSSKKVKVWDSQEKKYVTMTENEALNLGATYAK